MEVDFITNKHRYCRDSPIKNEALGIFVCRMLHDFYIFRKSEAEYNIHFAPTNEVLTVKSFNEAEVLLFNIEEATLGRAYLKNIYNEFRKHLQK